MECFTGINRNSVVEEVSPTQAATITIIKEAEEVENGLKIISQAIRMHTNQAAVSVLRRITPRFIQAQSKAEAATTQDRRIYIRAVSIKLITRGLSLQLSSGANNMEAQAIIHHKHTLSIISTL